jgi:hypothetical protein
MKTTQTSGTRADHQTVAGTFQFKSNGKAIAIGFTDQRLSPHAGSAVFWGWLRPSRWVAQDSAALPHRLPTSSHRLLPIEKALAFMHGLLCDARKLTHAACLRRDPPVPELLGIERVASQSARSRFFQEFDSAGGNLRCFRPLWHWGLDRRPSRKEGYTLDLDSTRLLPKDGHQEGVAGGYTQQGIKPCLHPRLAVPAEVRLVAQLWLRPGNTACGGNVTAFFLDLLQPARPPAAARGAGRCGLLSARTAGLVGATAFAPCGRGGLEPAHSENHQRRSDLDRNGSPRQGSGPTGIPDDELAAPAPAGADRASGARG